MGVTRGYWGEVGLVVASAGGAALLREALLLVGAAGVGGWLLARHYAFVRDLSGVAASLSVTQSPERERVTEENAVELTLEATLPSPTPVALDVETDAPVGVRLDGEARTTLQREDREATATVAADCPLAGEFRFDRPTVRTTDESGRFTAAFAAGDPATLTVDARAPRDIHVGSGGETIGTPYGELDAGERGSGLNFAELRSYVPGDAARNIDRKATARSDEAYVRTYETTAERRMALLVDCRTAMATGPSGAAKFDYLRKFALGLVAYARERSEPLGLYAVGDEGVLVSHAPAADEETYATIERRLREFAPSDASATRDADATGDASPDGEDSATRADRTPARVSPAAARERSGLLRDDDSAYADRLGPFFGATDSYVQHIAGDPLYGAVRAGIARLSGDVTTVVLTDDSNRDRTRAAIRTAARGEGTVLAFLTPTALFERAGRDPEETYRRYVDFERYRRELDNERGVAAFEVAPGDELSRLLASHKSNRRSAEAGD